MWHKLLLSTLGIYVAYITMSLITQKMYNTPYQSINPDLPPSTFKYPSVIIWLGALLCACAGSLISLFLKQKPNPIPLKEKILLSGLFSANILTTNYCLLYISYPVQVIGRNIRFLFVVIIGAFFSRVKNTHTDIKLGKHKIFMALVITSGVLLYNFTKQSKKDKADKHDPQYQWLGYLLLTVSVVCDALFSDSQAYAKASYKPTANHLFTTTNFYGFIIIFLFSLIVDRSILPAFEFMIQYPSALFDILIVGVLQVIGQICIYYVVANFKQHVFPLISTTRKIITVISSIFVYGHYVNNSQWASIFIVFCGMFYQLYEELTHRKHKQAKKVETAQKKQSGQISSEQQIKTQ